MAESVNFFDRFDPQDAKPEAVVDQDYRPKWMDDWLEQFNIGDRPVKHFKIHAIEGKWVPETGTDSRVIVVPYFANGRVVNRLNIPISGGSPFLDEGSPVLFNADGIDQMAKDVIFVGSVMDAVALFECGHTNVVAISHEDALSGSHEGIENANRAILAGVGLDFQEKMARRIGRHRCWLVGWPQGSYGACDVLKLHGPLAVEEALTNATEYPIDGLYRISAERLLGLRARQPPATMTTGTPASDAILRFPTEGRLIVVTGYPGSGKTSWTRFIMVHTCQEHGRRWAVFSPEMMPWEQFAADCAEVLMGKPFWPVRDNPVETMSENDIDIAGRWLEKRMTMLVCDSENEAPTLDWLLDKARIAVLRDGATDLLLDPWNELAHMLIERMTETDYIGRSLQRLKAFGNRYGCNVWIIVHPSKPSGLKAGEAKPAPGPYDCSGSSHWANKPDLGLTVHTPILDETELHVWKTRFKRFGRRGEMADLRYDALCGRYTSEVPPPPEQPRYNRQTNED